MLSSYENQTNSLQIFSLHLRHVKASHFISCWVQYCVRWETEAGDGRPVTLIQAGTFSLAVSLFLSCFILSIQQSHSHIIHKSTGNEI